MLQAQLAQGIQSNNEKVELCTAKCFKLCWCSRNRKYRKSCILHCNAYVAAATFGDPALLMRSNLYTYGDTVDSTYDKADLEVSKLDNCTTTAALSIWLPWWIFK